MLNWRLFWWGQWERQTTTDEPGRNFIRVKPAGSPSLPSSGVGDTGFQILLFVSGQTFCFVLNGDWACVKIIVAERWLRSGEMLEENRDRLEERLKITSKIPFQRARPTFLSEIRRPLSLVVVCES